MSNEQLDYLLEAIQELSDCKEVGGMPVSTADKVIGLLKMAKHAA